MMIILFFIILIVIVLYNLCQKQSSKEGFGWDPIWIGKISEDCYNETPKTCLDYANCGMCLDRKGYKCLPGDAHGPFFTDDCQKWKYTNRYDRKMFDDSGRCVAGDKERCPKNAQVTRETPTWNVRLPDYETWYPSPVSRSALV